VTFIVCAAQILSSVANHWFSLTPGFSRVSPAVSFCNRFSGLPLKKNR
jgi:hypothetical protein